MDKRKNYHYYLDAIEKDIPDVLFPLVGKAAYASVKDGPHVKYLLGLYLLHSNRHEEALKIFKECADAYPLAVNPKIYYVLTSIEMNYPLESEVGYLRDFYLFELRYLESSYMRGFLLAFDGLKMILDKQKLSGVERIKQAEVLSGNFYPAQLLIARAYGAVGELKIFEKYYQALIKSYPRLEQIRISAFSIKDF
jgi:tetratricopeptide (TPR) repeat protein